MNQLFADVKDPLSSNDELERIIKDDATIPIIAIVLVTIAIVILASILIAKIVSNNNQEGKKAK